MKKIIALLTLFVIFSMNAQVMAADEYVSVNYSTKDQQISIQGNLGKSKELISLIVMKDNFTIDGLTPQIIEENNIIYKMVRSESDGDFFAVLQIPSGYESGTYRSYAAFGDIICEDSFSYVNKDVAEPIISLLNAADKSKFYTLIDENKADLALDTDFYNNNSDIVKSSLFAQRKTGYTMDTFSEAVEKITGVYSIANDSTNIERYMEKYGALFGVDYETAFKPLSDRIKSNFITLMGECTYQEEDLGEFVNESLLLASVKGAATYSELQSTVIKNYEKFGIDLKDYNNLSNDYKRSQVFEEMKRATITSFDDVKKVFDRCVEEISKSSGGSGGAGGTGGAGGSGSVSGGGAVINTQGTTVTPNTSNDRYTDIGGHWAKDIITSLSEKSVISGFEDNSFRPDQTITRAEFMTLVSNALSLNGNYDIDYKDVNNSNWFYPYVARLVNAGIVAGDNGYINPYDCITREQSAVIIYKALGTKGINLEGEYSFNDDMAVSDYAKYSVSALGANKIINGYEGSFRPKDNMTRAEAAVLIFNLLDNIM